LLELKNKKQVFEPAVKNQTRKPAFITPTLAASISLRNEVALQKTKTFGLTLVGQVGLRDRWPPHASRPTTSCGRWMSDLRNWPNALTWRICQSCIERTPRAALRFLRGEWHGA
jgi:hypothetical protein